MSIAPYFSNLWRGRNIHSTTVSLNFWSGVGTKFSLNACTLLREVALGLSTPGLVNTFSALISSSGPQAYITQLFFSSSVPTPDPHPQTTSEPFFSLSYSSEPTPDTHPRPLRCRFFRRHIHPCQPQTHTPDHFGAVFFAVIFIRAHPRHTPQTFSEPVF